MLCKPSQPSLTFILVLLLFFYFFPELLLYAWNSLPILVLWTSHLFLLCTSKLHCCFLKLSSKLSIHKMKKWSFFQSRCSFESSSLADCVVLIVSAGGLTGILSLSSFPVVLYKQDLAVAGNMLSLFAFFSISSDTSLPKKWPFIVCVCVYAWCRRLYLKFKSVCACKIRACESRPACSLLWEICLAVFVSVANIVK